MMISIKTPKKDMIKLAPACSCDACQHGCKYGSGAMTDQDLKSMAEFLRISEEELKAKHLEEVEKCNTTRLRPKLERKTKEGQELPFGQCTFFTEDGKCKVHVAKPLECKISTGCASHGQQASHWFMLNYFVDENDPESLRQWSQALKNTDNQTIAGGTMEELVPDKEQRERIMNYTHLK